MPIVAVTRLRLRDPSLLDEFFTHAAAVLEQAMKSEGNLGADALAEARDALVEHHRLATADPDASLCRR